VWRQRPRHHWAHAHGTCPAISLLLSLLPCLLPEKRGLTWAVRAAVPVAPHNQDDICCCWLCTCSVFPTLHQLAALLHLQEQLLLLCSSSAHCRTVAQHRVLRPCPGVFLPLVTARLLFASTGTRRHNAVRGRSRNRCGVDCSRNNQAGRSLLRRADTHT
jgi:hypothetical protein